MSIEKTGLYFEGKSKRVYETTSPDYFIMEYKDEASALHGQKKGIIREKGVVNNSLSNHLMELLELQGIATHVVAQLSPRETLVWRLQMFELEVVVRNITAGTLSRRLGLPEGVRLKSPILEYRYKNRSLEDPLINESHILALDIATAQELVAMDHASLQINQILREHLLDLGTELIDFKLEFGKKQTGELLLADEISPDTCRFWDSATGVRLDKDRFRRDMGGIEEAYQEVLARLTS